MHPSMFVFTLLLLTSCHFISIESASVDKGDINSPTENQRWRRVQCGVPSRLSEEQKLEMLNAHNQIRRQDGADVFLMSWDENLAARAQEWANQCQFSHSMMSDCEGNRVGQNAYMGSSSSGNQAFTMTSVVQLWASEKDNWDFRTQTCQPNKVCGHWTQVMWSTSTRVGCGFAQCPSNKVLVFCDYSPGGNMMGEKPFTPGDSCTACHKVTRKSDTDRGFKCVEQLCVACSPGTGADCRCGPADRCDWNAKTCSCDCPKGFYGERCDKRCVDAKPTSHCQQWKSKSYCNSPSLEAFMQTNCAKTCGVCKSAEENEDKSLCSDVKPPKDCKYWKSLNYCKTQKYKIFMHKNCAKTCGVCKADGEQSQCTDIRPSDHCQYWKSLNHCNVQKYKSFMQQNCASTCGVCK